jgi:hypothetical protein
MSDVRMLLTDKTIARLPSPNDGWYLARDTELRKTEEDLYSPGRSKTGTKAGFIYPSFDWRHP